MPAQTRGIGYEAQSPDIRESRIGSRRSPRFHDVIDRAGILDSQLPCHDGEWPAPLHWSISRTDPFWTKRPLLDEIPRHLDRFDLE